MGLGNSIAARSHPLIKELMLRDVIKGLLLRVARPVFRYVFPPLNVPFASAEAQELFPGLHDQNVVLGKLDWKWGDLTAERTLIFLCSLAKKGCTPIVEFGTFRGRTTYNLALNSTGEITTIDIGHELGKAIDVGANIEKHEYASHTTGEIFLSAPPEIRDRIKSLRGDSTKLDYSHLYGKAGLVIVDGGHSYEVCKSDSEHALRMVRPGGVIVWDDYSPYWPGVIRALDELSTRIKLYHLPHEKLVVHLADGAKS